MLLRLLLSILTFFAALVHHSCTAQGLWPAAIPLAVRSPYLNSWLPASTLLPGDWPNLWDEAHIFGHYINVRVDGVGFQLMGRGGNQSSLANVLITPTQTSLIIQAGPMLVNLTYLSPIEPQDLALQSFPFSYIILNAQSTDGKPHAVQFYADISGEWVSGDLASLLAWNTSQTSAGVIYHEIQRSAYQSMQETNGIAEDSTAYFATLSSSLPATYQSGADLDVRNQFAINGKLLNTQDTTFRAVNDRFPVFAFSWDVGTIQQSLSSPVVFALGLVRDPSTIYTTSSGNTTRSSYFFTRFATVQSGIETFLSGYNSAQSRADDFDRKLNAAASAVSPNYADLVSLSTRAVMAGSEITVSKSGNKFNASDIMMFMKDIGISRRVNPVEVLYASFPAFMYLNATWGGYLLEPLLRYQLDMPSGKPFAIPDLGANFPSATGNTSPAIFRAIEDSSSMLIMAWAQARFSGDVSLIERYYGLFKSWTDYLVSNTLAPTGFMTADGLDNSNMTNLAIKGITGIRAMAEISKSLGAGDDSSSYLSKATSFAKQWQTFAGSTGHLQSTYDSTSSWGLIYNLFPDQWLDFNLVDPSIYTAQSSWYTSEAASAGQFGLPYDSNDGSVVKAQWTMFTVASMNDTKTRNALINMVHLKATTNSSAGVFPTTYNAIAGNSTTGSANPALGAVLSVLSLDLPAKTVTGTVSVPQSRSSMVGAIVGGTVGAVVFIVLLLAAFLFWRRRQKRKDIHQDTWEGPRSTTFFGLQKRNPSQSHPPILDDTPPSPTPYPLQHRPSQRSLGEESSSHGGSSNGLYRGVTTASRGEAPPLPRKGPNGLIYMNPPTQHSRSASSAAASDALRSPQSADATTLRNEVENLRREMDEMRARGLYEPPPSYV